MHRLGPLPDPPDIIDIRSDSEEPQRAAERTVLHPIHTPLLMSSQPSTQSSSVTLVTQPVVFIDLTRIPSASSRCRVSVPASSQSAVPRSQSTETSSSIKSIARPRWLEDAIEAVEKDFPRARFTVSAQGMLMTDRPENWELQCDECEEYVVIPAGPSQTLKTFVDHLDETHSHFRRNPPATEARQALDTHVKHPNIVRPELRPSPLSHRDPLSGATTNGTPQRMSEAAPAPRLETNAVEAFLAEHGLGPDVMPILQDVGITDSARMRALGRLPEHYLDRLERSLSDRGLDFAACLLVREGLRRLAEVE